MTRQEKIDFLEKVQQGKASISEIKNGGRKQRTQFWLIREDGSAHCGNIHHTREEHEAWRKEIGIDNIRTIRPKIY